MQQFPKYSITRNDLCPCGSGKKFKFCCNQYIENSKKNDLSANLLKKLRLSLTELKINHQCHTVPMMKLISEINNPLLLLDIDNAIETICMICYTLSKMGLQNEIDYNLENLKTFINSKTYSICLICLLTIFSEHKISHNKYINLFSEIGEFDYDTVLKLKIGPLAMKIYITFMWDKIEFEESIKILNKTIEKNKDSFLLGSLYQVKGQILYLNNKLEMAKHAFEKAIRYLQNNTMDNDFSNSTFLEIYKFLFFIDKKEEYYKSCVAYYNKITKNHINRYCLYYKSLIACIHEYNNKLEVADEILNELTNSFSENDLIKIDCARVKIKINKISEAEKIINNINSNNLNCNIIIDYLDLKTRIAFFKKNKNDLLVLQKEICNTTPNLPYIVEIKNHLILSITKGIYEEKYNIPRLYSLRKTISKTFILQPNFFGLGVNFNEIIDPD